MLRTALRLKWLGLLVVAVLIAIGFSRLGAWQLGVAKDKAVKEAIAQAGSTAPVPIDTVLTPHSPFKNVDSLRRVTITGSYAAQGQFVVPQRRLDGRPGVWVVAPFVESGSGNTLPVLRGFATSPDGIPAPPTGEFTLTGALAPSESPSELVGLPEGQLGSIDLSVLVNRWVDAPYGQLYNAFLFTTEERGPAGVHEPQPPLTRVPVPSGDPGLNWRNAMYAVQWWVFAAFALWLWWRMVRQARTEETADRDPAPSETPTR